MRFLLILTVLTVLLTTGATEAQAYTIGGSGVVFCGSWTIARRDRVLFATETLHLESWVLGFLSGIGFRGANGDDPLDGVDAEGVWGWIDNYCLAHPDPENIGQAAAAFYFAHPHR